MAPSLRKIRQALTRKRKAEGSGAPSERKAVAKIARRAKAERVQATEPLREEEARSKTASDTRAEAVRADAGGELSRSEEEEGDRPCSSLPRPSPPPVVVVDASPVRGVETPPPGAIEAEPECPATRPTPGTVPLPLGAENRGPPSVGEPDERESVAGSSAAATKSLEGSVPDHSFQTILRCSRWAEETLDVASVPEIQVFLQRQKRTTFFREASVAHLWALNSLTAMRSLWAASDTALEQAGDEMEALRSRAERAEMALEDARATIARAMRGEVEAAQLKVAKLEEALDVAKRQAANELDNAQVAEEKQKVAEEKQKMAEGKLETAESKIYLLNNRLHSANIEIGVAGERAENAEEIARQSEARIAELEVALAEAERKTSEAGEKAAEAERRALKAVEDFRKSSAYDNDLAESTALAYQGGFQECKEKVLKLYGLEGVKDLEPDEVSEDDSTQQDH